MDEQKVSPGRPSRRRFVAGAGAAAGIVGAGVLGASSPAGASVVDADHDPFVVSAIDMSSGPPFDAGAVSLGTGGSAEGEWEAFGNLVFMNFRIVIGEDPTYPYDQLCVLGPDLPATYRPALPFDHLGQPGTAGGFGSGVIINYAIHPSLTSYALTPGWVRLPIEGAEDDYTAVLFFTLTPAGFDDNAVRVGLDLLDPHPFELSPGTMLVGSLTYFGAPT